MGNKLAVPVLGLVVVCLLGIIGGAFLVSWLKEVLQKELNKKNKNSSHGKNSQKLTDDPNSNINETAPNIYQCRTCTNKILLQGDDTVVDIEPSLPERHYELPTTSRAGQSEYRNPTLINQKETQENPYEQIMYRNQSHETLLDNGPGRTLHTGNNGQVKVSQRPTRNCETSSNVHPDDLTRYESILKMNAARGPTGWAIVRQNGSDDERIPVTGTGIRRTLSWSDHTLSSPHYNNEYPGMKNEPYKVAKMGGSYDQSPHPANKIYYDCKIQDSISYVNDPRNSPTSNEGNKHQMQMANRSKLVAQGSYGGIGGRVPADSAYHAHYEQMKPNNSDPSMIINRSNNVIVYTPKRPNNTTNNEREFNNNGIIENLPPPPPPMDDDEQGLPPSYDESEKDFRPINVSNH